jgi:cardiolipin synthase A/B
MRRPILHLLAVLLGSIALSTASAQAVMPQRSYLPLLVSPTQVLLIAALHYDGIITGEPDEAFQVYNPNDSAVLLNGWHIRSGTRTSTFPPNMSLAAHAGLWCGREAWAFRRSFGRLPDCEWGADTDPKVPNLQGTGLSFANSGAAISLRRPDGSVSDVLIYKAGAIPAEGGWQGRAVYPYVPSSVFHEQGQVLYRKLNELTAAPLADTDGPADWASDPDDVLDGRRVRYAGWSLERFLQPVIANDPANLEVFVAPDNAFAALGSHLEGSADSICFEGYTFESAPLGAIIAERARAGVPVTMLLEGAPPGGVSDQQRWVVQQLSQAGARIYYMRSDSKSGIHDRYTNQHAKIWLIDDRLALIGTENPSPDSFPDDDKADGTLGRRGVYVATGAPAVVGRIREIMAADMDEAFADVWPYDPSDPDLGAPPPEFSPVVTSGGNTYAVRVPEPLSLAGQVHLEVCQAPENGLSTSACILGLVNRASAGDDLLVEQLSEPPAWGPSAGTIETDPNPRVEAYLAAARRGARVRLLLDAFFDDLASSRSNLRTEEYLNSVAASEGLDLQVRRGNPTGLGLHNKMVLARIGGRGWSMVGSLNGGEASAKVNREVSLVLQSDEAYNYLASMFWGDWGP